jgi:hypothetical protein
MLGFCCCCAAAGALAVMTAASDANRLRQLSLTTHDFTPLYWPPTCTDGSPIAVFEETCAEHAPWLTTFLIGADAASFADRQRRSRLKAGSNHAGLVYICTLHILRLASLPRELPMCMRNAPTYRRIACLALLRSLRGRLRAPRASRQRTPPVGRARTSWSYS